MEMLRFILGFIVGIVIACFGGFIIWLSIQNVNALGPLCLFSGYIGAIILIIGLIWTGCVLNGEKL